MMITMSREELLEKVKNNRPYLGWDEKYPNLFGRYGHTYCTIYDNWFWYDEGTMTEYAKNKGCKPLSEATDIELLEMLALSSLFWLKFYQNSFRNSKEKSSKLDDFIAKCETDYFGYGDEYTEKTIDTIFNKIYDILDEKFKKEVIE